MSNQIDLSKCKRGDTLIGRHGAILEYIAPTPYGNLTYLDHVVRYIKDKDGNRYKKDNFGTRTNDGYVFLKNRIEETDEDIVKIIPQI